MSEYQYYDLEYEKEIKKFQYLPYLDYVSREYVDQFNRNILRKNFGYYEDENNPNNYLEEENRYINDRDRFIAYRNRYTENDILYENLTAELNNLIIYYNGLKEYKKQKLYEGYLYKIQSHIYNENKRILKIANEIDDILVKDSYGIIDNREKHLNINQLIIIMVLLFILCIFVYNYTYIKL